MLHTLEPASINLRRRCAISSGTITCPSLSKSYTQNFIKICNLKLQKQLNAIKSFDNVHIEGHRIYKGGPHQNLGIRTLSRLIQRKCLTRSYHEDVNKFVDQSHEHYRPIGKDSQKMIIYRDWAYDFWEYEENNENICNTSTFKVTEKNETKNTVRKIINN